MQPTHSDDQPIRPPCVRVPTLGPERTTAFGWTRFLVLAVLFHGVLLLLVATIKIAIAVPIIAAIFEEFPVPSPVRSELDPFLPLRDYEYTGGGRGGSGGSGSPVSTPAYHAAVLSLDARHANQTVGEIIGIRVGGGFVGETRLEGNAGGLGAPFGGDGSSHFGAGTGFGVGGSGFSQRTGPLRAQAIRQHKGAEPAERAVVAALRWLKDEQRPDGGWSYGPHRLGISALAILAFLGHGETPDSEEFGQTLTKAFQYLTATFNPNLNMYEHAIVTYALAEGYGMTRSPSLRAPLEARVALLLQAQKVPKTDPIHTGGWRYSAGSTDADTSVTGWCVQALTAARLAGVNVPQSALDGASKFLWRMHRDATFGYDQPGGASGTTAIGVLSQMFLGHGDDPRLKETLNTLKPLQFDWDKTEAPLGMVLCQWYYVTQVFFHAGGMYWQNWNNQFRDALIRRQFDDGHWMLPAMSQEKEFNLPPVYSTALCALMLEVYYRYLPTYHQLAPTLRDYAYASGGRGGSVGSGSPISAPASNVVVRLLDARRTNQIIGMNVGDKLVGQKRLGSESVVVGVPVSAPASNVVVRALDTPRTNQIVSKVISVNVGDKPVDQKRLGGESVGTSVPSSGNKSNHFGASAGFVGGGTGFSQRAGPMRAQAIQQHKGTERGEQAVVAALGWLKNQQRPDGGWSNGSRRLGISALATLAFLGHGETPDSKEFGTTLTKAFQFLAATVDPGLNVYEHAIVTYALAEGYGMTRSPSLRAPLEARVALLLQAQKVQKTDPLHTGGWRYSVGSTDADTSVTGWCVQALIAARLAGVNVPQSAFDATSRFLWNMHRDATFGYDHPGGATGTTAIGVLSQMFLGHGDDPRLKETLEKLKPLRFDWGKTEAPLGMVLYQWYYVTQVFFHAGGAYWQNWNNQFRDALIRRQFNDGHWMLPVMSQEDEFNLPPVYSTALCALMLEVYYRYLPTYQQLAPR